MSIQHQGGCVCGSVRYVAKGDPLRVTVCHCTWCQRRTGTAFAVVAAFDDDKVDLNGGARGKYRHISDETGRWLDVEFCPKCGTNVGFTLERRPGLRAIDSGTFDDPGWLRTDQHHFRYIFLRSAQKWSEVPAGAETYEKHFAT